MSTKRSLEFINKAAKMPHLTKEKERELGYIVNSNKDTKKRDLAANELVSHNILLATSIAYKYSGKTGVDVEDLIQAGLLGLTKASYLYNPKKFKIRFTTYATYWINEEVLRFISNNSNHIKVPLYLNDLKRIHNIMKDQGISDKNLIKKMKISSRTLENIQMANAKTISIDFSMKNSGSEKDVSLKDLIEDKSCSNPYDDAEKGNEFDILYSSISELDEISRELILSRYLSNDENKLREIGKKFNISGERVRQICNKALIKLRKKISAKRKRG